MVFSFLVPSAPPANVHVDYEGLSSIIVKWEPVPQGYTGGIIYKYSVKYMQTFSNGSYGEAKYKMVRQLKANLTELETNTEYRIAVAGVTHMGTGVYSEPVKGQTCKFKTVNLKVEWL